MLEKLTIEELANLYRVIQRGRDSLRNRTTRGDASAYGPRIVHEASDIMTDIHHEVMGR